MDVLQSQGLVFDRHTRTLYGANGPELLRIDPTTSTTTPIGAFRSSIVLSLAFDAERSILYGADELSDQLVTIDPTTGVESAVGPLGFATVNGLVFDEVSGTLYGTDLDTGQLLRIDPTTGAGTAIAPTGFALQALGPAIR